MKRFVVIFLAGILLGFLLGLPESKQPADPAPLIPVARLADGALYEGEMLDGMLNGQGKLEWPNGDRYEGNFAEGYFQGAGVMTYSNGDVYRGSFEKGTFHGQGVYKTDTGERYAGEFVLDDFTGRGLYSSTVGDSYVGDFKNWEFFGEGTYTDSNGDRYKGDFTEDGIIRGQFVGIDGEHYQGEFDDWLYEGKGRLKTAEGDVYEGEFSSGQYHGQGILTYASPQDGVDELSGEWQWGELQNPPKGTGPLSYEALTETVLYNQPPLLATAWEKLQAGNPEQIDLYFLGVAGYGSQAVFHREVKYVQDYFDQHLDTAGKSLLLVNDRKNVEDYPLATTTSIQRSLQVLADKMDAEQDILFVYLTSHGSSDFELSLQQRGLSLPDLPAQQLGELLKETPVKWKVVVISACYSGGFIPEVADENTLVLTAAAEDKASFGCDDDNDFTYFGEAYFKDALPESDGFVTAFEKAVTIINERESTEGITPSEPQMATGAAIMEQLESWRQQ